MQCLSKYADGAARKSTMPHLPGSGWYWRDVMTTAMMGKLFQYQNEVRVTTPTASVKRSTSQNITQNILLALLPNTLNWDTNVFWNASTNPNRLTVRSGGLYFVSATATYSGKSGGWRALFFRVNGVTERGNVGIWPSNTAPGQMQIQAIVYFHALDWIEVAAFTDTTLLNVTLTDFTIMAITPEAIL